VRPRRCPGTDALCRRTWAYSRSSARAPRGWDAAKHRVACWLVSFQPKRSWSPFFPLLRRRDGKAGYVYKLGIKNGKANIDEYAPIYTPDAWKFDGDTYEQGFAGLAAWAATLGAILLGGAYAVYATSAL